MHPEIDTLETREYLRSLGRLDSVYISRSHSRYHMPLWMVDAYELLVTEKIIIWVARALPSPLPCVYAWCMPDHSLIQIIYPGAVMPCIMADRYLSVLGFLVGGFDQPGETLFLLPERLEISPWCLHAILRGGPLASMQWCKLHPSMLQLQLSRLIHTTSASTLMC